MAGQEQLIKNKKHNKNKEDLKKYVKQLYFQDHFSITTDFNELLTLKTYLQLYANRC